MILFFSDPMRNNVMNHPETILVLDFGSQYSQLIARRVRELHVYSKIVSWKTPAEEIRAAAPAGIILSGGPASVYQANAPKKTTPSATLSTRQASLSLRGRAS